MGGKGGNWEISETPAFLTSGMVQGIVWASLQIPSCKTGESTLCFGIMDGQLAPHLYGDVHLFPSILRTEADAGVDTKGIPAASEGAWFPLCPRAPFLLLSPWLALESEGPCCFWMERSCQGWIRRDISFSFPSPNPFVFSLFQKVHPSPWLC